MTFETFGQSDEGTRPNQQKDQERNKQKNTNKLAWPNQETNRDKQKGVS